MLMLACSANIEVTIPRAVLQAKVAERFPIDRGDPGLASIRLHSPEVLLPGEGRLGLKLDATAHYRDVRDVHIPAEGSVIERLDDMLDQAQALEPLQVEGAATVTGSLVYVREEGAFYYREIALESLELGDIPKKHLDTFAELATPVLVSVLQEHPVYVLRDGYVKESTAKLLLKEIRSDEEQLVITFAPMGF
jgi:hypothetical protein